jgi:hypothetical protein
MICRRAVQTISQSLDTRLSLGERLNLGLHTLLCGPCRRFQKQLMQIHAEMLASPDLVAPTGELSSDAKQRIAQAIRGRPEHEGGSPPASE